MSSDASKLTIPGTTVSLVNPDWLGDQNYEVFEPCPSGTPSETDDYIEWTHDGRTEKLCLDRAKPLLPRILSPVPRSWETVGMVVGRLRDQEALAKRREALAIVEDERSTPEAKIKAINDFSYNAAVRTRSATTIDPLKEQFQTDLLTFLSDADPNVRSRAAWYLYGEVNDPRMVDIFVDDLERKVSANPASYINSRKEVLEAFNKLPFSLTDRGLRAMAEIAQDGKELGHIRVQAVLLLTVNADQNPEVVELLNEIALGDQDRWMQNVAFVQLWAIDPTLASEALEFMNMDVASWDGRYLWQSYALPKTGDTEKNNSIEFPDVLLSLHQEGLIPESIKTDLQMVLAEYAKSEWCCSNKATTEMVDFLLDLNRSQGIRYLSEILLNPERRSDWNSAIVKKLTEIYLGYRNQWNPERVAIAKTLIRAYREHRGCWYECGKIARVLRLYPHPAIRDEIVAEVEKMKDGVGDPQGLGFISRRSEVQYCNAYVDEVSRRTRTEEEHQTFYDLCVALKRIDSGQWQQPR